jgi:hypothetical protein
MFGYGGTQQQQQASAAAAAAALSSFGYPTGGQSNIQPASLGYEHQYHHPLAYE